MEILLGNAPVSWGVDYADAPGNPPWAAVMDGIAAAGYRATELGPRGFFPAGPAALAAALAARGLTLTAGFVFEPLHDRAARPAILEGAARTLDLLAALGARVLVVIDHISPERTRTAGRPERAPRLGAPAWREMLDTVEALADLALGRGVMPVLHPHAGSYVEFEDEIEAVLAAVEPARLGLCLDTGHLAYAGVEPTALLARHAPRVRHLHLKETDPAVLARARAAPLCFAEATRAGVFCPLGRGGFDWPGFRAALAAAGYAGAATVEQDADPAAPRDPVADARESLARLRAAGF